MKRIILIILLLSSLLTLTSCSEEELEAIMEDMVKMAAIYKKAEMAGKLLCPTGRPYRVGGVFGGTCVDEDGMAQFIEIRMRGSESYSEKEFILTMKGQFLGQKKGCPQDKPYFKPGFLVFGGKCMTFEEYSKVMKIDIDKWEEHEIIKGQTRYVDSPEYCEKGFLYDTHTHNCVSTSQCNSANMYFDRNSGYCECNEGYRMTNGDVCEKEPTNKECEYDSDCGDNYCSGKYKKMKRCNTRTYTCWTETVDCTELFGEDSTCNPNGVVCT